MKKKKSVQVRLTTKPSLKTELAALRAWKFQLTHQCGTDDIDVIAAKVRRIKTVQCTRCGQSVEAVAVGDKHHITENHVCEIIRPQKFTLRFD